MFKMFRIQLNPILSQCTQMDRECTVSSDGGGETRRSNRGQKLFTYLWVSKLSSCLWISLDPYQLCSWYKSEERKEAEQVRKWGISSGVYFFLLDPLNSSSPPIPCLPSNLPLPIQEPFPVPTYQQSIQMNLKHTWSFWLALLEALLHMTAHVSVVTGPFLPEDQKICCCKRPLGWGHQISSSREVALKTLACYYWSSPAEECICSRMLSQLMWHKNEAQQILPHILQYRGCIWCTQDGAKSVKIPVVP